VMQRPTGSGNAPPPPRKAEVHPIVWMGRRLTDQLSAMMDICDDCGDDEEPAKYVRRMMRIVREINVDMDRIEEEHHEESDSDTKSASTVSSGKVLKTKGQSRGVGRKKVKVPNAKELLSLMYPELVSTEMSNRRECLLPSKAKAHLKKVDMDILSMAERMRRQVENRAFIVANAKV
ncbi:MAG: hypothetical protein ACRYE7_02460, partial [Janthinobacterium lividum]